MAMLETGYFYFIAVLLEGATAEAGRQIRTGRELEPKRGGI